MTTPDPTPAPAPAAGDADPTPTGPAPATTGAETAPAPAEGPVDPTAAAVEQQAPDPAEEEPVERVLGVGAKGDPENPAVKALINERTGEVMGSAAVQNVGEPLADDTESAAPADNTEKEKPNG